MIEEAFVTKVEVKIEGKEKEEEVVTGVEAERPPPPKWLDGAFMQEALRRGGHEHVLIEDFEITYAIAPGDNYCSTIYRVKLYLKGTAEPIGLLVKSLPAGEHWVKTIQEQRFFVKESIVFSRVLPALNALLTEAAPGRFPPFAARCLHHGEQPSPFIVLQDLRPEGFRMADRRKGLDLDHSLLALKALGRFHGASAALWRCRPELFEGLISPFIEMSSEKDVDSFNNLIKDVANAISKWEDFPGDYGKKMLAMKDSYYEKIQSICGERPGKFNVLVHEDFWSNNMLFSFDGDAVKDVRFVDFQGSHIGTPAIDLYVFKYSSLQEEVLDNHWDILLEAYIDSLTQTLHTLGEVAPTLQDIRNDLQETRIFSLMVATLWIPVVRREEGVYDIDKASADGNWAGDSHDSPVFQYWMRKLLPTFFEQGVFN